MYVNQFLLMDVLIIIVIPDGVGSLAHRLWSSVLECTVERLGNFRRDATSIGVRQPQETVDVSIKKYPI